MSVTDASDCTSIGAEVEVSTCACKGAGVFCRGSGVSTGVCRGTGVFGVGTCEAESEGDWEEFDEEVGVVVPVATISGMLGRELSECSQS